MKTFFRYILFVFIFLITQGISSAKECKILVLPDCLEVKSSEYFIYNEPSELLASDIIDYLDKNTSVKAPSVSYVHNVIFKNQRLELQTRDTLKRFKYTYNINYQAVSSIAKVFGVDKVLLITSGLDTQSYILRRTFWDFLNIPGAAVIDPAYMMTTNMVLVDVNKEVILWQNLYRKKITKVENRMMATNFGPAYEQLNKIKIYSTLLAEIVGIEVSNVIDPKPIEELQKGKKVKSKIMENGMDIEKRAIEKPIDEMEPFKPIKPPLRNRVLDNFDTVNQL